MCPRFLVMIVLLLMSTGVAWCDSGDQYALAKIGSMQVNENNATGLVFIGGIYGVGVTPSLTVEGEANVAVGGGKFETTSEKGQYDIWTVAGYLAYRYVLNDTVYFKIKGGMVYENVKLSSNQRASDKKSTGFGGGGGLGVGLVFPAKKRPVMLELEITATDEDLVYYSFALTSPF